MSSGRYKNLMVDGSGGGYLKRVCDYVDLNPVRAGVIAARLCIGTRGHLTHLLYWQNREKSLKQQLRRLKI